MSRPAKRPEEIYRGTGIDVPAAAPECDNDSASPPGRAAGVERQSGWGDFWEDRIPWSLANGETSFR